MDYSIDLLPMISHNKLKELRASVQQFFIQKKNNGYIYS